MPTSSNLNNKKTNRNISCGEIDVVSLVSSTIQHSNFNVNEILKKKELKRLLLLEKYEYFYNLCLEKISNANNAGMSDIIFKVPHGLFSFPDYNCRVCLEYISEKLINSGFNTHILLDTEIFVTWIYLELNLSTNNKFDNKVQNIF